MWCDTVVVGVLARREEEETEWPDTEERSSDRRNSHKRKVLGDGSLWDTAGPYFWVRNASMEPRAGVV